MKSGVMTLIRNANIDPFEKLRLAILWQAELDQSEVKRGNIHKDCYQRELDIFYASDWFKFLTQKA